MNVGFVLDSLKRGGAQKMMAFVIQSVASMYDNVYLLLEDTDNIGYQLPANVIVKKFFLAKEKKGLIQKMAGVYKKIKGLRACLEQYHITLLCSFGCYYTFISAVASSRHNISLIGSERRSPRDLSFVWRILSKYSYNKCTKVVFQLDGAMSCFGGKIRKKAVVIPNPCFQEKDFSKEFIIRKHNSIALAAARLEYVKGFDVAIKALPRVLEEIPDAFIEIYGAGDFEKEYGKLINRLHLNERVFYKGFSNNIIDEISKSAVFVLPSRYEGIPNILLEALAAGIPCIASNCRPGGPQMLIGNNERGILFENENTGDLAKCLIMVLKDKALADKISTAAQEVRIMFSPSVIGEKWVRCFEGCKKDYE